MKSPKVDYDIKAWRKFMGWTQEQAAKRLCVNVREVQRWETKKVYPYSYLIRKMKKFELEKLTGTSSGSELSGPPPVRRKLPLASPTTGQLETISIAPSSW